MPTDKPESPDAIDALIAASEQTLSLSIDPAWKPSIKENLVVSLRFARMIDTFPLSDEIDPAAIFEA